MIKEMYGMRTTWEFQTAGQLIFGDRASLQLPAQLQRRRYQRVFVLTDRRLQEAGLVARVADPLQQAGLALQICSLGEPEPSLDTAQAAVAEARSFQPDVIVGLGGGSNMDLAKVAAATLAHGGSPRDYFGWDRIPGPVIPLVCVPTTAGTGSEVSHAAVLTDTAQAIKVSTLSNFLRPALAVVDPELTWSCPPQVTADSGIDALTHAIEALTAVDFNQLDLPSSESAAYAGRHPLGDCLAEQAIQLIGRWLVTAVREPQHREARAGMSLAATLAGMAFSNCAVALVHALEYPLGGELHVSHGAGNGLLLPYVMRFNLPERQAAFARVARLLGEPVDGLSEAAAAACAITAVEKLKRAVGIPDRIRDIGGREEQLPRFAEKAFAIKRLLLVNPRRASQQDLLEILRAAY